MNTNKNTIGKGFTWKLLERFGVAASQFVLQIVLARLLAPSLYGTLSLMIIFVNLATVFIQNGFNTSLLQKKDIIDEDYSSVFWLTTGVAFVIYLILYFSAPLIEQIYNIQDFQMPFRIMMLVLFFGAYNSIQLAIVSRNLDFKKVFTSSLFSILISGGIGILMAYNGFGLWALVIQYLLNCIISWLIMLYTVKWVPKLVFNVKRTKELFNFGWKLLVSGLLDTLYTNLQGLVIGLKYNENMLAFYYRGQQFPSALISAINGSIQSVLLPTLSNVQDDKERMKISTRKAINLSSYIVIPIMMGLACVAKPLVLLLLKEKWLPCVPYLQICCFGFAFYPIHTSNLQAINAQGRSDIFLRLEIYKKLSGLILLMVAIVFFDSPIAIALSIIPNTLISSFINASPNKKLLNYSYLEQIKDIVPYIFLSCVMGVVIYPFSFLNIEPFVILLIQVILGVAVYFGLSAVVKIDCYYFIKNSIKQIAFRRDIND